jgi:uncharacterized protein (TIGR00725 family)
MQVTVFGTARSQEGDPDYQEAYRLGRLLAEAGHSVCTGGYAGAMEAVSRGAHEVGGHVVGITLEPWTLSFQLSANRWVREEVATANLYVRLERLLAGDALVAIHGGVGTLTEVAFAWNLLQTRDLSPRPLILLGADWRALVDGFARHLIINEQDLALLTLVDTPEAVIAALHTFDPAQAPHTRAGG